MSCYEQSREALRYKTLTDPDEIASIGDEWDGLLDRSQANRAFSSSKWYLASTILYPELKPLVLLARRAERLAAVFPLVLDTKKMTAGFQGAWSGYSDIIAEADDVAAVAALLSYALLSDQDYKRLLLRRLRTDSASVRAMRLLDLVADDCSPFLPQSVELGSYASLEQGYESYMGTRTRNLRHNMARVRNKASRQGITMRELRASDIAASELSEKFLALHTSRFGEQTVLKSSASFLDALFPALFTERRMRVFALLSDREVVGMHLAMVGVNSLVGWNAGFRNDISSLSPGRLLLHCAIEHACADALEEYDLREGNESYKNDWKTHTREIGSIEFEVGMAKADALRSKA